jgi:cyclophilin family peptidyl-prolyl cis-trans isomerase/protein-disulfide isomerase
MRKRFSRWGGFVVGLLAIALVGCQFQATATQEVEPSPAPATLTPTPTLLPTATSQPSTPTPQPTAETNEETDPTLETEWQIPRIQADDWVTGGQDAGMVLVEYSDFQCPYCAQFTAVLLRLKKAYPDDLRVVFRHFPLKSIHDKAVITAQAAEAAGAQGKFWEMHDLLFGRQNEWSGVPLDQVNEILIGYARELDLDVERFAKDLEEGTFAALVEQRYGEAVAMGLGGVPTVFINGEYYDGPRNDFVLSGLVQYLNYDGPQFDAPPPMIIDPAQPYFARVETSKGNFCVELYADRAPQTVNNWVFLAEQGFYDGVTFHRVLPGLVAQTGDPTGSGFSGPGYQFDDEIDPELTHDGPGILSMANAGPNTNGSQFFITYKALPELDGKHTVFGRVVEGMDVVEALMPRDPQEDPYAPADRIVKVDIATSCEP